MAHSQVVGVANCDIAGVHSALPVQTSSVSVSLAADRLQRGHSTVRASDRALSTR